MAWLRKKRTEDEPSLGFSPPFDFDFARFHPANSAYMVTYNAVTDEGFLAAPSNSGRPFRGIDLPVGEWVTLDDRNGRPAPVQVRANRATVEGRWIL